MKNLIKKILLQEVEKKYSKPTPNVEKLIYNWLDNYFDGAKMYQMKDYEFSYTFEWCNNGMEIARFSVDFNHDHGVWDDKRKTSEREFDDSELWVPEDIVNDLQTDIPVRRNYLRYVIEEWFEDTMIEKIQSELGRNDISINSFSEHPEKSQVCVPPVSKPEGVSDDEMIDFIVKNTLWKANDLIKKEKETPGYIDKLYVDKLRSLEIDRVRGSSW
jgi:hypothetical protein